MINRKKLNPPAKLHSNSLSFFVMRNCLSCPAIKPFNMRTFACPALIVIVTFFACNTTAPDALSKEKLPLEGTWKLFTGILIEKGDSVITDYTKDRSFIKVINATHFAFMGHDLINGKDSTAFYTSGGGKYELSGNAYTEHLEYCNDRQWEGNDFHFTVSVSGDTLVQQGVEKIESAGVDRINIEKYVRLK